MEDSREDPTAVHGQDTPSGSAQAPADPQARALALLADLRAEQEALPPGAALAWERAAFREAFLEAGPGQRIRAFLEGTRPGD